MARFLEKLHSSPSSRGMQLFAQPLLSMWLRFLAKLSRNCLGICQEYGKRCRRLQKHAGFVGKQLQYETCQINLALSSPGNIEVSRATNHPTFSLKSVSLRVREVHKSWSVFAFPSPRLRRAAECDTVLLLSPVLY